MDVEALQRMLAELTNENKELKKQKKFGLVWEDKPDAQVLRVRDEAPMLCEDTSKAVVTDQNTANHILINGDNFHALTALRATHTGKVDVIYIDPPYNTGNKDFIYNDSYLDKEDGYRHSKWLSFMEKRLSLAKELLTETGVVFVSIDDNEQARLRLLMDEIFGPDNFISNVVWQGGRKNNARYVSNGQDYILMYFKNEKVVAQNSLLWREQKFGIANLRVKAAEIWEKANHDKQVSRTELKKWFKSLSSDDKTRDLSRYSFFNADGSLARDDNITSPTGKGGRYQVLHPITGLAVPIPDRGWIWSEEKMKMMIDSDEVIFGKDHHSPISAKRHLDKTEGNVLTSVFERQRTHSKRVLEGIMGANIFDFPKDHEILAKWINVATQGRQRAVILDFFAGSGTTAHAVAELNKEDGGSRQCILVTDGGKTEITGESSKNSKEGAVNIAEEVTYERVRRVLTGKDWADGKEHEPLGGNLRYFKVEMEPTPQGITTRDQRLTLEKYTIDHAKIATNIFNEVASKNELNDETLLTVDYKVYADEGNARYLIGVNTHDFALSDLEEWFNSLPEDASVVMVGNGLEEIEWVRRESDRITVDDVLGRVIRSRKHVASKLPLI